MERVEVQRIGKVSTLQFKIYLMIILQYILMVHGNLE